MGVGWGAAIMAVAAYAGAQQQAGAAEEAGKEQRRASDYAARLQYDASLQALQFQKDALAQARQDFAPYLSAGTQGLAKLSASLPQYVQNTIMPMAQAYGAYTPSALPSANWSINPVTGAMQQYAQPGLGYTQPAGAVQQSGQQGSTVPTQQPAQQQQVTPLGPNGRPTMPRTASATSTATPALATGQQQQPAAFSTTTPGGIIGSLFSPSNLSSMARASSTPTQMPMGTLQQQAQYAGQPAATTSDLTQGGVLSPTVPTLGQGMNLQQYAFNPNAALPGQFSSQAGLPTAPELAVGLNYQFDTNDPVYQQKLAEKNRQIDAFLAKQGLQGSSAGESFRQEQINRLLAEEESRQYGRAVAEREFQTGAKTAEFGMGMQAGQEQFGRDVTGYGLNVDRSNMLYGRQLNENELAYARAKTERDYGTQVAAQQYGLEAQRGDTLYNRLYGQQTDLYNRMLQGGLVYDEQQLGALGRQYSLAQDVYGTLYGGALDQAKMGAGAAASTGAASTTTGANMANTALQTGQGLGQAALYAGNAAAQSQLAQGQAQAGLYQSLGTLGGGLLNQYATGGSGGYNPYAYGTYNYYNPGGGVGGYGYGGYGP